MGIIYGEPSPPIASGHAWGRWHHQEVGLDAFLGLRKKKDWAVEVDETLRPRTAELRGRLIKGWCFQQITTRRRRQRRYGAALLSNSCLIHRV